MGLDVLEAHTRNLTRNKQHRRAESSKLFMPPDTPDGFSHITREEGVSGNAHTARWAGNHHPNKSPEHGSKLHRVTVTNRIMLNNITRAVLAMKQRAEKVVPSPAPPNTDSRPAELGRRIRASRRGGRAIRKDKELAQAGRNARRAAGKGKARSGMELTDIAQIRAQLHPPASSLQPHSQWLTGRKRGSGRREAREAQAVQREQAHPLWLQPLRRPGKPERRQRQRPPPPTLKCPSRQTHRRHRGIPGRQGPAQQRWLPRQPGGTPTR